MDIKVVKTREEYEAALEQLAELMNSEYKPGSEKEDALELLLVVIKDYEQRLFTRGEADPVSAIKFRMDQMHLTRKDLVPFLGSLSRVTEVLAGDRGLSLSMIRRLHEGLGIPYESLVKKRAIPRSKKPR